MCVLVSAVSATSEKIMMDIVIVVSAATITTRIDEGTAFRAIGGIRSGLIDMA